MGRFNSSGRLKTSAKRISRYKIGKDSYVKATHNEENVIKSAKSEKEEKMKSNFKDTPNASSDLDKEENIGVTTEIVNEENKFQIGVKIQEDSNAEILRNIAVKHKSTEDFRIVRGTFHQGNTNIFSEDSVGRQCTANAAAAIVMTSIKAPESWKSTEVNSVLMTGDVIYQESIANRPDEVINERNSMYLNAVEVKTEISFGLNKQRIKVETSYIGHLYEEKFGCLMLIDRLNEFLQSDASGILTANSISVAIGRSNDQIWMFDSHARDFEGKACDESSTPKACLTMFKDVNSLFALIKYNIPRLPDVDTNNMFELYPVKVEFLYNKFNFIEERRTSKEMLEIVRRRNAIEEKNIIKNKDDNTDEVIECEELNTNNEETNSKIEIVDKKETSSEESQSRKLKREKKRSYKKRGKQNKKTSDTNKSVSSGSYSSTDTCSSEDDSNSHKSSSSDSTFSNSTNNTSTNFSTTNFATENNDILSDQENLEKNYSENHEASQLFERRDLESDDSSDFDISPEPPQKTASNGQRKTFTKKEDIDETEILLVNFAKVWKKLAVELAHHRGDCPLTNIIPFRQTREGNRVCFEYKCKECSWKANIWTTEKDENSMDINEALVLGGINSGTGYSQMKKLFSAAGIKFMTNSRYRTCRDKAYKILWSSLHENMKEAGRQELEIALPNGNEINGIGLINVLADGSWMKRSYKTGSFNSPAGAVYIVGEKTGKILWLEIKNMYCSICDRAKNRNAKPKKHECFKNWSRDDSSSSMETVAISEGFKSSITEHNLIYAKLIADGDSSVYNRIREIDPYREYDIEVEKLECCKHLRRAFENAIKEIVAEKVGFVGKPRQIVEASGRKCIMELDRILNHFWEQERPIDEELCDELSSSIDVIPRHVFGNHENCLHSHPLCNGIPGENEENVVDVLQQWEYVDKVEGAISRLSRNAKSLLLNYDTNVLESAFAIVAEKIGGKRINYALRNEYHCRILAAALQFNTRQVVTTYYKEAGKEIPTIAATVEEESKKCHENRKAKPQKRRRRRNKRKYGDKDYGPNCQEPDMDDKTYAAQLAKFEEKEKQLIQNRDAIEKETKRQDKCPKWHRHRKQFITASICRRICSTREGTSCHNIIKDIRIPTEKKSKAISWGKRYEKQAKNKLEEILQCQIEECGLFIHPSIPGLAATPDGYIREKNEIVEIKCPFSAAPNNNLAEAYLEGVKPIVRLFTDNTCKSIKKSHEYYFQIQMQLETTEADSCHLMVWTPNDYKVIKIKRDKEFWKTQMEAKLKLFYETCLKPEIIDSRLRRGMRVKDPSHILEAKRRLQELKLDGGKRRLEKNTSEKNKAIDTKQKSKEQNILTTAGKNAAFNEQCEEGNILITAEEIRPTIEEMKGRKRKPSHKNAPDSEKLEMNCHSEKNEKNKENINNRYHENSKSTRERKKPKWMEDYVEDYPSFELSEN